MKFKKYSEIENSYRQKYIDYIREQGKNGGDDWLVTEKIHGCVHEDTLINTWKYGELTIKFIIDNKITSKIKSFNIQTGEICFNKILNWNISDQPTDDWYEIETKDNKKLIVTGNHPVWCNKKQDYIRVDKLDVAKNYILTD